MPPIGGGKYDYFLSEFGFGFRLLRGAVVEVKKTIELNYGRSLKFNKQNYEQDSPMWHEKVTIDFNGETPDQILAIEESEYQALKTRIDDRANMEWERVKATLAGLRVREKDGKKYPSVTSIISPEPYTNDPEYGIRGTEIHRIINHYALTGEISAPEVPLTRLSYEDINYRAFLEKHKSLINFKGAKLNMAIFHDSHMYSGELDMLCRVKEIPSLIDIKTGGWKWKQLVAYHKALPEELGHRILQLAIFDLKKNSLDILPVNSPKYISEWEAFLVDRGVFKARFSL